MVTSAKPEIIYPESDGKPLAEDTKQLRWIIMLVSGMEDLFKDETKVFIAGDLLWYPVEGKPTISAAPDTMVVFGRPKGDRRSYLQWKEENIAPQVVFEVLSYTNTKAEMATKLVFYDTHKVEEYYVYNPEKPKLEGYLRVNGVLEPIPKEKINGWVSPRLGIRFELDPKGIEEMQVFYPDGRRFVTYAELSRQKELIEQRVLYEQQRSEQETHRADHEQQRANQEQQRAEREKERAEEERQRAERLLAKLRALNIEVEDDLI